MQESSKDETVTVSSNTDSTITSSDLTPQTMRPVQGQFHRNLNAVIRLRGTY